MENVIITAAPILDRVVADVMSTGSPLRTPLL